MKKITYLLLLLVTFAFSWQGYGQYAGTGTFTKITDVADIVDNAYYVIIDETSESFAMSNSHTGSILEKTDVTPSSSTLTNPASSIVWEIKTSGTGKSIYNAATAKYVSYTGSSNNIQVVDAVSSDNQRWAITFVTDEFQFTNIAVPARRLQYNSGSPRFVCYKPSSNQKDIAIYKMPIEYCTTTGGNDRSYNHITNVTLGVLNQSSDGTFGYTDYTAVSAPDLQIGSSSSYSIGVYNSDGNDNYTDVWIDWNQDDDFDDANEHVIDLPSTYSTTLTGTITAPAGATLGNTRMRIMHSYYDTATGYGPCVSYFNYGEVEDYTVNVTASACAAVATFSENFDSSSSLPDCWFTDTSNDSSSSLSTDYANSGTNSWELYSGNNYELAGIKTNELSTLGGGNYRLKFSALSDDSDLGLKIGTVSSGGTYTEFTTRSFSATGSFENFEIDFSSYVGTDERIMILNDSGDWNESIYIDDIVWEAIPSWTWTGATNTDWATTTNWSEGSVPTATDNVVIPASTTLVIGATTGAVSNDLTVDASASLSITSGGSLIVSGTSTGDVTYNRTVGFEADDLKGWYLMASPVVAQDYNDGYVTANDIAVSGTNRGIATYTTDGDTWAYHQGAASATFTAGKGYSVKRETNTGTVSFTGTLNTSDSGVDFVLDNAGNRINLLGNPYTSFISSNTLLGNAALSETQTMWIYDQTSGDNGAYAVKTLAENFILAPGQGFFVKADAAGGTVNFAEANQSYNADTFQRTVNTEIKIKISVDGFQNYAKVYYLDNATNGFDVGYEGELFGGATDSFSIYTQLLTDNLEKKYQVQSLPNSDYESMVIPVGVKAAINKEITFSAETLDLPSGIKVFLEDRATSTFTRLDEANSEYTVTLTEATNGTGRFYLHTSSSSLSIGDTVNAENISIYRNATTLKIAGMPQGNANVKLFNILGRQVLNTSFKSTGTKDISLANLASGVYIVQLETSVGMLNKKIILN